MSTADTFLLTLQVNDEGSIKIQNFNKVIQETGDNADKSNNKLDKSVDSFRMVGLSASKLAENLGLPFRASHMLGTKIEEVAKVNMPSWGFALGAAGIATAALSTGVIALMNHKEKLREEVEKNVTALTADMDALYSNEQKTKSLQKSTQELALAKRSVLLDNEQKKLIETTKEYQKQINLIDTIKQSLQEGLIPEQEARKQISELTNIANVTAKEIAAQTKNIKFHETTTPDMGYPESERLAAVASYNKAVTQLWIQEGLTFKELMEAEKSDFQNVTDAKLAAMSSEVQQADYSAQRRIELEALVAQRTKEFTQTMMQMAIELSNVQMSAQKQVLANMNSTAQSFGSLNSFLPGLLEGLNEFTDEASTARETEQGIFDQTTDAKLASLRTIDEKEAYLHTRDLERNQLLATQERQRVNALIGGLSGAANFSSSLTSSLTAGSKKNAKEQFEAQKKAGYAQAIISTAAGIAKAFEDYSYPYSLVIAALVAASGFAQVASIASTSYDGGGDIVTPGASAAAATSPETTASSISSSPVTNIYVQGDILDMDQFSRKVLPSLKKAEKANVH